MKKEIFPIIDQHGGQINDEIGAQISMIISKGRDKTRDVNFMFTKFLWANNYVAWHIENGWFHIGGKCIGRDVNNRLHYEWLSFTWYMDFRGSFGGNPPKVGESMVIVDPFQPELAFDNGKTFELHCYKVTHVREYKKDGIYMKNSTEYHITMDKIETRIVYFDPKLGYQFYISSGTKFKNWWKKMFKKKA